MKRTRLTYFAGGGMIGLLLTGLGWGLNNFYLVVAGAVIIAVSLASLTMPTPTLP
jgi:hypothetical protein